MGELVKKALGAHRDRGWGNVWYRGQSRASWTLLPKLWRSYRNLNDRELRFVEAGTHADFRSEAISRSEMPTQISGLGEWLVLMQHHGLPTRLLDWTESLAVAAFFAVHGSRNDHAEDGAVWFIDPRSVNQPHMEDPGFFCSTSSNLDDAVEDILDPASILDWNWRVICIQPREIHPRIRIQYSRFTMQLTSKPLEADDVPGIARVTIPADAKDMMLRELELLGCRRSHLFPTLDELARDIADRNADRFDVMRRQAGIDHLLEAPAAAPSRIILP